MSASSQTPVLRITRWTIWLMMALMASIVIILALVAAVLPFHWSETVADLAKHRPAFDSSALMPRLYGVFALAVAAFAATWMMLRKLLAIIASVAHGDPFVIANAVRLKAIGWLMVAVQVIGTVIAWLAREVEWLIGEDNSGFGFSLNGLLAILLVFVLAGVFERGAAMREELEGTV